MDGLRLVELIDENLVVKPVLFNIKNFSRLNEKSKLYYYSFNESQVDLGEGFWPFLHPYDEKGNLVAIYSEGFHENSFDYYGKIIKNVFENLNKIYGNEFKDYQDFKKVRDFYEFEYEHVFSIKGENSKYYSESENEAYQELNLCKNYENSLELIKSNLSKSKIYSKYFWEVYQTVETLKEKDKKISDLKECNSYLLKLYDLENFIPKLF